MFLLVGPASRAFLFAAGLLLILFLSIGLIFGHVSAAQPNNLDFSLVRTNLLGTTVACHGTVRLVDSPNVGSSDNQLSSIAVGRMIDADTPANGRAPWP